MKRILACLLALALCVSLSALAEEPEWTYDKTWGYVNGYSGPGGDVVLPAEVNGHPVRVLQSKGLTRREDITSFTASEGLLVLGDLQHLVVVGGVRCGGLDAEQLGLPLKVFHHAVGHGERVARP